VSDTLEAVAIRMTRGSKKVPGIRLHELFAWTLPLSAAGTATATPFPITHVPTGCIVAMADDRSKADRIVAALLRCTFVDWSAGFEAWTERLRDDPLSEAQLEQLRMAQQGYAPAEAA
jgi:hypothetical protein